MINEFDTRYSGKYYGKYRGVVKDAADPNHKGRIRVECRHVYGVDQATGDSPISGWALPMMGGSFNSGAFSVPPIGSQVWVEFEQGDIQRPLWMPGAWSSVGGENNATRHAKGGYDDQDNYATNSDHIPPSQFNATYPNIKSIRTPAGHTIEFDDTAGSERVLLSHSNGTRIEMLSDGTVHHITTGNKREVITGSENKTVGMNTIETRQGFTTEVYEKTRSVTDSQYEHIVLNGATYTYKKRSVTTGQDELNINGGQVIQVVGDKSATIAGHETDALGGRYKAVITETAKWIIMNAGLDPLTATGMHLVNPIGRMDFKVGIDPSGVGNVGLNMGLTPLLEAGGAQVLLKAITLLSLEAAMTSIGALPGMLGKEPLLKAASFAAFFDTHIHPAPDTPPAVLMTPLLPLVSTVNLVAS